MKGDFTRDTFDPRNHFSRVLMQQGRVQLDADSNEQTAILLHYMRTLAKDILGPHAGPADGDLGFAISTPTTDGNFAITKGRYYVQGILVENEKEILYSKQTGYPFDDKTKIDALKGKKFLVYLDVWERHMTYVEDDHIREAALGGPDTCSRAKVVWQVKVLLQSEWKDTSSFGCDAVKTLLPLVPGKLRARARLDKPSTELCVIPPESRYRGAENQLYRVEIHRLGNAWDGKPDTLNNAQTTAATFKWSRENGSVTFPIRSLSDNTVTLEYLGRDKRLSLEPGDWVEVVDEHIAMGEKAGPLAEVDTVNRDGLSITLKLPGGASALPNYTEADMATKHPLLRRWDHQGDPKAFGGALPIEGQTDVKSGWIDLEDGVQVWFSQDGEYRAGDYWLIPARIATGDVEWPDESDGNPIGKALEPHGPRHYYAPLFLAGGDPTDCRCRIINPLECEAAPLVAKQVSPSKAPASGTAPGNEPTESAPAKPGSKPAKLSPRAK